MGPAFGGAQSPLWRHSPSTLLVLCPRNLKNYASDRYVSSYTPSLSALIESQRLNDAVSGTTRSKPQMLVVGTVDPSMPDVGDEIDAIEAQNPGATILRGEDATSDAVLKALQSHTWVHLACHGVSQMDKPFLSAFKLDGDQGITLQDLVRAKLPNAEFAFLSACHTAEHAGLHDEVLHLAAAMQFCGFRSVVGTMWAMPDVDGFLISKKFYQVMLSKEPDKDDGWKPKYSNAAVALAAAVKELRLTKVSLERWVNYVHIGA